jgi:CAAX protease family protein
MHTAFDHVLFATVCFASPLADWLWLYPRLVRATASGVPGKRVRGYLTNMLTAWGLTACVLALWANRDRPWTDLRLGIGNPLGLGIGFALTVAYMVFARAQRRSVLARPDASDLLRRQLGRAAALMPQTPREFQLFLLVAITAGICEELLFRGFVMWYLAVWTGAIPAAVISSVLFGFAHIYIGIPHVIRSGLVGAVFATLVLATGSLWPAIVLHAAVDLFAGDLTYHALHPAEPGRSSPP